MTTQRVQRASGVLATDLGANGVVLLHIGRAEPYELEATGADIWRLLDEPQSVEELVDEMTRIYAVGADVCRAEVCDFVARLLGLDLVQHVV